MLLAFDRLLPLTGLLPRTFHTVYYICALQHARQSISLVIGKAHDGSSWEMATALDGWTVLQAAHAIDIMLHNGGLAGRNNNWGAVFNTRA